MNRRSLPHHLAGLALASAASLTMPNTTLAALAPAEAAALDRNPAQHNVPRGNSPAIQGYDPVAYFPEGGGKPAKGADRFEHTHAGVTYRFANQANLERFKANPDAYEPAHGGWCAYAMAAKGEKVEIDPRSFVIQDGRLLLFYKSLFSDTRADWIKGPADQLARADANWKKLSGESPRSADATLQSRLDDLRRGFEERAPKETSAAYEQGIREVAALNLDRTSLQIGAVAPDFSLPNADGRTVTLAELRASGPVVVTWYRGGWCPYCNLQLRAFQEILPELRALGANLAAISPETPDHTLSSKQKNKLDFYVLSDVGNEAARRFGIAYALPKVVADQFAGRLDLSEFNGDHTNQLPLSATYVIGRDGRVVYRFVDPDYRKRAEPRDVLEAVRSAR